MRFWDIKNLLLLSICMAVSACGTSNFNYVSSEDLLEDPLYLTTKDPSDDKSNYGALRFNEASANDEDAQLFILQKEKGAYIAETMLKNKNSKRYFFSVGVDYRKSMPRLGFRIEF